MTETPTIAPGPAAQRAPAPIEIDDDATPIVRLLGRTLRDAVRLGHLPEVFDRGIGTVAVRSHNTPQAATVTLCDGAVTVTGGVFAPADATLVVDLEARFALTQDPDGDADLADGVLRALQHPLPSWQEAAERFWEVTRGIRGIPDVLIAVAQGRTAPRRPGSARARRPTAWSARPTRSPGCSRAPTISSPPWTPGCGSKGRSRRCRS